MNSKPPMTRVIQLELEAKIKSGELAEGDRLYSLRQIAAAHGVSIAVALAAVRALEKKGLVEPEPGRGVFVKRPKRREDGAVRLCSWNGIFPSNSIQELFSRRLLSQKDCLAEPFYTDDYEDYLQYFEFLERSAQNPETAFDIVSIDEGLLPTMARNSLVLPLNKHCEDAGIDLSAFPEKVLRGFCFNGKLYGLPVSFTPSFIIFNKSIFEAEGVGAPSNAWTWKSLYDTTVRMTKSSGDGQILRYGLGISFSINAYAPFILQNGGELLDRNGSCAIGSDEAVEALGFFSRLYALPGVCSHRLGSPRSELADLLSNGLLAMILGDADDYKAVRDSLPASAWGLCRLPAGKAGRATSLSIHGWGLSASAVNPKRALKLLASFLNPELYRAFSGKIGGFPAFHPKDSGVPSEIDGFLKDASPIALQSTSRNAFKAFATLSTALKHRILLSREKCQEFQRKIDEML